MCAEELVDRGERWVERLRFPADGAALEAGEGTLRHARVAEAVSALSQDDVIRRIGVEADGAVLLAPTPCARAAPHLLASLRACKLDRKRSIQEQHAEARLRDKRATAGSRQPLVRLLLDFAKRQVIQDRKRMHLAHIQAACTRLHCLQLAVDSANLISEQLLETLARDTASDALFEQPVVNVSSWRAVLLEHLLEFHGI
mmetsp:Transcript_51756/g.171495  ORF Transcript_51756/g.171495 Transcript_51756/m.171495 type:complete len:200 (-) Transcript_51756:16-615(-)